MTGVERPGQRGARGGAGGPLLLRCRARGDGRRRRQGGGERARHAHRADRARSTATTRRWIITTRASTRTTARGLRRTPTPRRRSRPTLTAPRSSLTASFRCCRICPTAPRFVSHEQGRPDTYHAPGGLDTSGFGYSDSTITLDYGNDFGSSTKSMLVTWKKTDGGGATLSQKGGFKFTEGTRFQDFAFTASYALSGSGNQVVHGRHDVQGRPQKRADLMERLRDDAFDVRRHVRLPARSSGSGSTPMVGYEASNVRYGAAVPRGLSVTGTTPDTVTLECGAARGGAHNAANEYALERLNANTGAWETVHTFAKPNVTADSPEEVRRNGDGCRARAQTRRTATASPTRRTCI